VDIDVGAATGTALAALANTWDETNKYNQANTGKQKRGGSWRPGLNCILFRHFLLTENLALFAAAFYFLRTHARHGSNLASLDFVEDVEFYADGSLP
jgi:hypothetical protein